MMEELKRIPLFLAQFRTGETAIRKSLLQIETYNLCKQLVCAFKRKAFKPWSLHYACGGDL